MADRKISALTAKSAALAADDKVPYVDKSDTTEASTGTTKYMTVSELFADPLALNKSQPAPTAKTTDVTLTIAELLTRIITGTHTAGATQTYTLPTGTLCDAGGSFAVDTCFDWILINLSAAAADTITVAAGADHTVVGNMVVQSAHATTGALFGNSAVFRTRKTAANTFVTYRIG